MSDEDSEGGWRCDSVRLGRDNRGYSREEVL